MFSSMVSERQGTGSGNRSNDNSAKVNQFKQVSSLIWIASDEHCVFTGWLSYAAVEWLFSLLKTKPINFENVKKNSEIGKKPLSKTKELNMVICIYVLGWNFLLLKLVPLAPFLLKNTTKCGTCRPLVLLETTRVRGKSDIFRRQDLTFFEVFGNLSFKRHV